MQILRFSSANSNYHGESGDTGNSCDIGDSGIFFDSGDSRISGESGDFDEPGFISGESIMMSVGSDGFDSGKLLLVIIKSYYCI